MMVHYIWMVKNRKINSTPFEFDFLRLHWPISLAEMLRIWFDYHEFDVQMLPFCFVSAHATNCYAAVLPNSSHLKCEQGRGKGHFSTTKARRNYFSSSSVCPLLWGQGQNYLRSFLYVLPFLRIDYNVWAAINFSVLERERLSRLGRVRKRCGNRMARVGQVLRFLW